MSIPRLPSPFGSLWTPWAESLIRVLQPWIRTTQDFLARLGFLSLTDTPKTYGGQAGKFVAVNATETGLEFVAGGGGGGGQAAVQFQDEGANLGGAGTVDTLNFVGGGVTAARAANTVTVTVPAGVSPTRAINTTAPLAGGGDLSADRTLSINANGISDALLRQGAATSVIGRSANSVGNVADIAAASDGQVLRRSAGALGFGTVPAASVTGLAAIATSGSASDLSAGLLPAARFDDTSHGSRGGGGLHANFTSVTAGFVPASGGGTTNFLRADATWAAVTATAANVSFSPAGNIIATNVQAAIVELDNEKVAKAGDIMTGDLTINKPSPGLILDGSSGNVRYIDGRTGGLLRNRLILGSAAAESGSDAGSDLNLAAFNDAGTLLGSYFTGARATQIVTFPQAPRSSVAPANAADLVRKDYSDNASNLATGTVATARLGSGVANSTTFLRGDGTWAVPPGAGGGTTVTTGTTTVNFGAYPGSTDTSVTVVGQASIAGTSAVKAWIIPVATADHSATEHIMAAAQIDIVAGDIVAGVGFTIYAVARHLGTEPLQPPTNLDGGRASTTVLQNARPQSGLGGSVGGTDLSRQYGQYTIRWEWF